MAESRLEQEWEQTSSVLALLANVHRDPKKGRRFSPADFNPFAPKTAPARAGIPITAENIGLLRAFVKEKR